MKSTISLTIEKSLLQEAKTYAEINKTSLSQLIETYLKGLLRNSSKENIIEYMKNMSDTHKIPTSDLKTSYYKARKKKYGF